MFELFGREVNEGSVGLVASDNGGGPTGVADSRARQQLTILETERYVTANRASPVTHVRALKAIRDTLSTPSTRFVADNAGLWRDALHVFQQSSSPEVSHSKGGGIAKGQSPLPLQALAETCSALLLSHHGGAVAELVGQSGLLSGAPIAGMRQRWSATEFCAVLTTISCYVLSCCAASAADGGEAAAPSDFDPLAVKPIMSLLTIARQVTAQLAAKEDRHEVVVCVELLLFSLDWLFQDARGAFAQGRGLAPTNEPDGRLQRLSDSLFAPAKELAPRWLRDSLFLEPARTSPDRRSGDTGPTRISPSCTPSQLRMVAQDAAHRESAQDLGACFAMARQKEEASPGWRLFGLARWAGEALLRCRGGAHTPQASAVVSYLGTSLEASTLASYANATRREGAREAVRWLSLQQGKRAYAALKTALFHHPPEALATIQESRGDILSGNRHATWRSALEASDLLLASGQTAQWRAQLPTTLRLLSDAGHFKEFFRLVREYDPGADGGRGNLAVAAALGQAMRRTSQWQFYNEVLDLVAGAPVPACEADDNFLEDAALQTLYALRNARRWDEAATLFGLLRPVMKAASLRVFASVLSEAAAASLLMGGESRGTPRDTVESLLRRAQLRLDEVPADVREVVDLYMAGTHALEKVDIAGLDERGRKHVLRACVGAGIWQPLLTYSQLLRRVRQSSGPGTRRSELSADEHAAWLSFLRALENCPDVVPSEALTWESVADQIPSSLWCDERGAVQLFHTALWNGWLDGFLASLQRYSSSVPPGEQSQASRRALRVKKELAGLVGFLLAGRKGARLLPRAVASATGDAATSPPSPPPSLAAADIRHSLLGHYYTSFVMRDPFRVPVHASLSRGRAKNAIARHFRVPPVCVGAQSPGGREGGNGAAAAETETFFLRPYPADGSVGADQVLLCGEDFIVAYKPSGAVHQSVARGVVARGDTCRAASSFHLAYLMPPEASGLFLLVHTKTNPKRFCFDLTVAVDLIPLGRDHVALLSTVFFQRFRMSLAREGGGRYQQCGALETDGAASSVVRVEAVCERLTARNGSDAVRAMKAAANEEGWTFVERDVGTGDAYTVVRVCLTDTQGGEHYVVS